MSEYEISQRILCTEAKVDSRVRVRVGKLTDDDWTKISHAVGRLSSAPLWIDDNPNTTVPGKSRAESAEALESESRQYWDDSS